MCEAEREHLQRLAAALQPEEHTPELRQLLECYEDGTTAAELLRGVKERVETGSSLRGLLLAEDAELFRGLVLFVQSIAKGYLSIDAAILSQPCEWPVAVQCAEVLGVITPDGRVHAPGWATGERAAPLPAFKALAALAASASMPFSAAGKDKGGAVLEQALRALWPACNSPSARRLGASSHGLPRRTAAAAAAVNAIVAAPPSSSAAALAAALERHCPGVSLAQLRTWALVLHIATLAYQVTLVTCSGETPSPECEALAGRGLQHCCLLLHSGGSEVAGFCFRNAYTFWPMASPLAPMAAVVRMLEEGLAWAKEAQCWYTAAHLCQSLAPHLAIRTSLGAALSRAQQLLTEARCMEWRLKFWLPPVELARLKQSRGTLEDWLQQGAVPEEVMKHLKEPTPLRTCTGCGLDALYLRLCSGCRAASYCSRECQRRDWREGGHKQRCAALAAERQRQQQGVRDLRGSGGGQQEGGRAPGSGARQRTAQRAEGRSVPCSGA